MQPGEYEVMARVEARHWWYRGLRDAIDRCLAQPDLALPPHPDVLDAGCGTGENLRFVKTRLSPGYLGGFDASAAALAHAREKAPTADLYRDDLCAPALRRDALDLVLCLDAIQIPGAARALPGLRRLASALRPGGLLVINVPAFAWLRGAHDVAVHTTQRFTAPEVARLLEASGLHTARLSYRLCLLLPLVLVARRLRGVGAESGAPRSELHASSPGALDAVLLQLLRLENRAIARGRRLPFGSSVFAIGRKP